MIRRLLVALAVVALLASPLFASGRSKGSSSPSSGTRSQATTSHVSSSKPVRVRSYVKKNGTVVSGHTRALPGTRSTPTAKSTSLRGSAPTKARAGSVAHGGTAAAKGKSAAPQTSKASQSQIVGRTANGKIKRSEAAKDTFLRQTGYPHGRAGYIVDHIVPLACGGADRPSNMQWQTVQQAKAKDKIERNGCH